MSTTFILHFSLLQKKQFHKKCVLIIAIVIFVVIAAGCFVTLLTPMSYVANGLPVTAMKHTGIAI